MGLVKGEGMGFGERRDENGSFLVTEAEKLFKVCCLTAQMQRFMTGFLFLDISLWSG